MDKRLQIYSIYTKIKRAYKKRRKRMTNAIQCIKENRFQCTDSEARKALYDDLYRQSPKTYCKIVKLLGD